MISSDSNGPQKYISSISRDGGHSIKTTLDLGRLLVDQLDRADLTQQWMAYHLAELINDAESRGNDISFEQRAIIVDTILKIWSNRRTSPGTVLALELDRILEALDMLGDETPWRFSRLRHLRGNLDAAVDSEHPLIITAVNLERATRQALLVLIWLACQDAIAQNETWLEVAGELADEIEDDLIVHSHRIYKRMKDSVGNMSASSSENEPESWVQVETLAKRLRNMAQELVQLADQLEGHSS